MSVIQPAERGSALDLRLARCVASEAEEPNSSSDPRARRSSPRVEVAGHVLARLMTLNVQVDMREVSFGGFRLASSVPVSPGEVHEVRAVTANGLVCTLLARVVHCHPPTDGEPFYISGWRVEPDPISTNALAAIVDSLTTARLHFSTD
jgi:hypothetical protein